MSEETDNGILTLATQGSITFVGNIAGRFLGFLFVAIATRLVSPAEYGIFTLALSIVMFTQGFMSLNIYRSVDYFIPQFLAEEEYGKAKSTLKNVLLIGILSSVVGVLIIFILREKIAVFFQQPRLAFILLVFSFLIPFQTIHRTLETSFISIKKLEYRVLVRNILDPFVRILTAVILVIAGAGILGLVGGYLIGLVIAIMVGFGLLLYEAEWVRSSDSNTISNKSLLKYSFPLVLAGVVYAITGQIDYFVIGFFRSPEEVGQYRVAYLLAGNLVIVLTALTPIFKPMVAENKHDTSTLKNRFQLAARWITMLTLPLSLTLALSPEIYLRILFTEQYTAASSAVIALAIGYLFNASFGPEGMMLEGLGHTRLTLINTIVLVGINGVLDVLLVPRYGMVGAGIATGTAFALAGFAGVIEIYYLRGISPFSRKLARVWIAALFPIFVGILFTSLSNLGILNAALLPFFIFTSYLLGLFIFKGFSEEDAEIVKAVNTRIGLSRLWGNYK